MRVLVSSFTAFLLAVSSAYGQTGNEAVTKLERFAQENSDPGFAFSLNNSDRTEWRVGESVQFHVSSTSDCELQVLYIDSNGVMTLISPGMVSKSEPLVYPGSDEYFFIEPPMGSEHLFAICSGSLPATSELGLEDDEFDVVEAAGTPEFAERYIRKVKQLNTDAPIHVYDLSIKVKGRSGEVALRSVDIVDYFTKRYRSLSRPRLDLTVNFEFNSAQLKSEGAALLDEVAKAFKDDMLANFAFQIGGHTDDVGSEEYNVDLSRRRAESVKRYLWKEHGIESTRLEVEAYGEARPKVPNENNENRADNRRVELQMMN